MDHGAWILHGRGWGHLIIFEWRGGAGMESGAERSGEALVSGWGFERLRSF